MEGLNLKLKSSSSVVAAAMIMCLIILSLSVDPAIGAECSCCESARAKACCFACIAAGASDGVCKNTCCFPCFLSNNTAAAGRSIADYCKMGCTSSVCSNIALVGNPEEQQSAVEHCHDSCHQFCTKDASLPIVDAN